MTDATAVVTPIAATTDSAATPQQRTKYPRDRNGRPLLRIISAADLLARPIRDRKHLVSPWLREGESALLWAQPGVGKSMLTLTLALMMAGGGTVMDWSNAAPKRVLLLDGEMNVDDLHKRIRDLLPTVKGCDGALALRNLRILSRQDQHPDAEFPDLAVEEDQKKLLARVRDEKHDVVILDNFSTLASCYDENDAAAFNDIVKLLMRIKQAGVGCILVHHANKGGKGYRGSTKLATTFEAIFGMKRGDRGGSPGTKLAFVIAWEKYRGEDYEENTKGRLVRLMAGFDEGDPMQWEFEGSSDEQIDRVIDLLQSGEYATQNELGEVMGLTPVQVTRLKGKVLASGRFNEGRWKQCLKAASDSREHTPDADGASDF